jgi:hypothetical protein
MRQGREISGYRAGGSMIQNRKVQRIQGRWQQDIGQGGRMIQGMEVSGYRAGGSMIQGREVSGYRAGGSRIQGREV